MRKRWKMTGAGLFIALLLITTGLATGCGEEKKQLDNTTISDYNKPGTVFIESIFTADVAVPVPALDEQRLINAVLPRATAGMTEDQILLIVLEEFLNNPKAYIMASPEVMSTTAQAGGFGTGFIVNTDGYVVTNAHVVSPTDDELKVKLASVALEDFVSQSVAEIETALGASLTTTQREELSEALSIVYATFMTISNVEKESTMYTGVKLPGVGTVQKSYSCEIIKQGETTPGKDVAILKVNASNLPTVKLGDDKAIKDGEEVLALGYPGVATFNPNLGATEENVKPTLTSGTVSGRKTMPGGWEAIQDNADITNGNSGGPLLNKRGEVVGVNTFGSGRVSSTGEWQQVQGFNFAVPTTIVNEFLSQANVQPKESPLMSTYREAVDLFQAEHYSAAKEKFKEVQEGNAEFPFITDFISESTNKINAGLDKPTFPIPMWLIIVGVVVIVAVIAVVVLVLVLRKGGKKPGAAATPPTPPQPAAPTPPPAPEPPAAETVKMEAPPTEPAAPGAEAEAEEKPHFCSHCGHELKSDDEFCSSCGKHV